MKIRVSTPRHIAHLDDGTMVQYWILMGISDLQRNPG